MRLSRLKARVDALEQQRPSAGRCHRICVDVDDTFDAARARYEAEHGPIGENDRLIVREFHCPA